MNNRKNIKVLVLLAASVALAVACSRAVNSGNDELTEVVESHTTTTPFNGNGSCNFSAAGEIPLYKVRYLYDPLFPGMMMAMSLPGSRTTTVWTACAPVTTNSITPTRCVYRQESTSGQFLRLNDECATDTPYSQAYTAADYASDDDYGSDPYLGSI